MENLKQLINPYNLTFQEFEKLDGYNSLNYRIKCHGRNLLLKHYIDKNEYKYVYHEDAILKILKQQRLPFQIPASIREMEIYEDKSFSRLLPFIEGKLLSNTNQTEKLLFKFGKAAGILNKSLLIVKNDVIQSRVLCWDMKNTLFNEEKVVYIEKPENRKIITYYFDLFETRILPVQKKLRHSIIHSDLNDNNVITQNNDITGFIDFSDISYSPLIYEVAIALAYIILSNETSPFEKAKAFIQGYHSIIPLKKEEIELLYLLIPSRLCVSVCNLSEMKAKGKANDYILANEKPIWKLLHKWISINPIWIKNFFLKALGLPVNVSDIEPLQKGREKFISNSLTTSYNEPIYMIGGAFQYMYDNLGNTYLDACNNIPHIGHCHPNISNTISKHVRKLNTNTRYLYPELVEYSTELSNTLPESLHKFFYVNSGSAASDLAIRIAQTHTKRSIIAILENGYHGNTITGIEVSDYKHNRKGGQGTPLNIITLPLPKTYKGKFKTGKEYAGYAIRQLENNISNVNSPAALIVESISGCGGQVPLADGFLKELTPFLRNNNILLIIDEVQTGFGRLGEYFWGFEMHGVIPDILILGKPMGNGHPIAAVITTQKIAESFDNGMEFFSSFGGNPVSCAVALEALKTIKEENLQENAKKVGKFLKDGLLNLKNQNKDIIGDVRGTGLFLGIEFADVHGKPIPKLASFVKESLKKNFILAATDGPFNNVIKIKPPLCFNHENAENFLKMFNKAIRIYNK